MNPCRLPSSPNRAIRRGWRRILPGVVLALFACGAQAHVGRADLEAEFVVRLLKFVDWPPAVLADPSAPLRLCVLAPRDMEPGFGSALIARIAGHPLTLIWQPEPAALTACHAVYVDEAEQGALAPTLARVRDRPVLTISDAYGAMEQGVMIELYPAANTPLRFEVSSERAMRAGLHLNSQLLRVARPRQAASGAER